MQVDVIENNDIDCYSNILKNDRMFSSRGKAERGNKGTTKDTTPARQRIVQGQVECVSWPSARRALRLGEEPTGAKRSDGHEMKKAKAGTTDARSGGVFARPLTSELVDGPSKTPLHSLRE
jgi:hypothetical protein